MTKLERKHVEIMAVMGTFTDTFKVRVQKLEDELTTVRSAAHSPSTSFVEMVSSKIIVPEQKPFNISKNAKELENFL